MPAPLAICSADVLSLFSPLGMLADRAICSACVNFFLSFNDFLETNYLKVYRTDFCGQSSDVT